MNRPLAVLLLSVSVGFSVAVPSRAISRGAPEITPNTELLAQVRAGRVDGRRFDEAIFKAILLVGAAVVVLAVIAASDGELLAALLLLPLLLPFMEFWGKVQSRGMPGWVLSLHL